MNTRISLLLVFQGFLFAAFANIVKEPPSSVSAKFLSAIPVLAIVVAFLAGLGIYAASEVLKRLKNQWKDTFKYTAYIQPFGDNSLHGLAMIYNYGIPSILVLVWAFIFAKLKNWL